MNKKYNFLLGNPENFSDEINSMGYRAPEFTTIDWSNSIVVFGCSYVYGTTIQAKDTISSNLEKLSGRPVINMGVPASSIAYSVVNQICMNEQGIYPYAVINCWTSMQRVSYFLNSNSSVHIGPWITNDTVSNLDLRLYNKMFELWNFKDSNPEMYGSIFQRMARIIWKDSKHLEYTFFPSTANQLNVKLLEQFDFGLDDSHPGVRTTFEAAKLMAQELEGI